MTLGVLGLLCLPQLCNLHDEDVEREVEARCPGCVLRSWGVGEGDGGHAYVQLELTCDEGRKTRKREWLFHRVEGAWNRWEVAHAESCRPAQ